MINFYPGPSKIHPEYKQVIHDLLTNGLATYNHRSKEFMEAYAHTVQTMKTKLEVPKDYELFFLSSATECWETICQSFSDLDAKFLYNGAFGKKWSEIGKSLMKKAIAAPYESNETIDKALGKISHAELIAYVHNETSNGTVVRKPYQQFIRKTHPDAIIAVDATSSLGAAQIDYASSDIVFASVQKCIGAPAGLAIMIISPAVVERINAKEITKHYNDIKEIYTNHTHNQTTCTPNILGIISLGKVFEDIPTLTKQIEKVYTRAENFQHFIDNNPPYKFLIEKPLRSKTVFCIQHPDITKVLAYAKSHNIVLGKGYGEWRDSTIRIANFPAHTDADLEELKNILYACK
jgi:phosphoserine aminotransferase